MYYFHGTCKKKKGLTAMLRFYGRHDMLLLEALRAAAKAEGTVTPAPSSTLMSSINKQLRDTAKNSDSFEQFLFSICKP